MFIPKALDRVVGAIPDVKTSLWDERHHQVFFADPTIGGKLLQHGDEVLDAAVPVAQQENHHEQGQDAEEEAHHLQVCIGHLSEGRERKKHGFAVAGRTNPTCSRSWQPSGRSSLDLGLEMD